MRAMILAAGLGTRMQPLTLDTPKPLLQANGRPLLHYHLASLARAGVHDIVINTSHLAEQIEDHFGDGSAYGVSIQWSREQECLETGGGIFRALRMLGDVPFLVINGDIYCDFPYQRLRLASGDLAHLVLVDNPPQHPAGDFVLDRGRVSEPAGNDRRLTFAGISLLHPALFAGHGAVEKFALAPLLRDAMGRGLVSGERYGGCWMDIGTPERLQQLDECLRRAG